MEATKLVQDNYVSIRGLNLHYREWGDPASPELLILHGLTGHAWEFDDLASVLSERFHVIALNQRGHGASEWADSYTSSEMVEDVHALIEVRDLRDVRVIGHSMGGIVGWCFAARYPEHVNQLVVLDVGPDILASPEIQQWWLDRLDFHRDVSYVSPDEIVREYLSGATVATAEPLRQFVLNNLRQREDGAWVWCYDAGGLKGLIGEWPDSTAYWNAIRQVTCPVLVVRAGDSGVLDEPSTARLCRAFPDSRCVTIANSGHDLHIDQPELLVQELRRFLNVD